MTSRVVTFSLLSAFKSHSIVFLMKSSRFGFVNLTQQYFTFSVPNVPNKYEPTILVLNDRFTLQIIKVITISEQ